MKRTIVVALLMGALIMLGVISSASAQSGGTYDLSWSSVSGGGGELVGGNYTLLGALGQPEASTLSGGSYTLSGGFLVDGGTASFKVYLPAMLK